ncbi:STAS domain-containing protein, partial [Paraburkholderia diazotrophica]
SSTSPIELVICDLSSSPAVDIAGARMLTALHADLVKSGMRLRIVAAHADARDILRAEGLEQQIGDFGRRVSVDDVVEAFLHEADTKVATSDGTATGTPASAGEQA